MEGIVLFTVAAVFIGMASLLVNVLWREVKALKTQLKDAQARIEREKDISNEWYERYYEVQSRASDLSSVLSESAGRVDSDYARYRRARGTAAGIRMQAEEQVRREQRKAVVRKTRLRIDEFKEDTSL